MRVTNHPILGPYPVRRKLKIYVDDQKIEAFEGEPIAAALMAAGIKINNISRKRKEPRGVFCGIGRCTDCRMVVNGVPNVRTCVEPVAEGMRIYTQKGLGIWRQERDEKN